MEQNNKEIKLKTIVCYSRRYADLQKTFLNVINPLFHQECTLEILISLKNNTFRRPIIIVYYDIDYNSDIYDIDKKKVYKSCAPLTKNSNDGKNYKYIYNNMVLYADVEKKFVITYEEDEHFEKKFILIENDAYFKQEFEKFCACPTDDPQEVIDMYNEKVLKLPGGEKEVEKNADSYIIDLATNLKVYINYIPSSFGVVYFKEYEIFQRAYCEVLLDKSLWSTLKFVDFFKTCPERFPLYLRHYYRVGDPKKEVLMMVTSLTKNILLSNTPHLIDNCLYVSQCPGFIGRLYFAKYSRNVTKEEFEKDFIIVRDSPYLIKELEAFIQRPTDDPQWMIDLYKEKLRRLKEQNLF
jgi:hypothetical protein